ncbi:sigma-70 family RNA polymerase sigma factor [Amycolatopsis sp. NPDC005232]|uniref:RNA polymerase sigma factor n=1 Tax=Amycolatopsis sp. NPDC005232 TaxID=3157027 RepID=UPI0033AF5E2D
MKIDDSSSKGALEQRALALRRHYYTRLASYAVTLGGSVHEARAAADDAVMELAIRERRSDLDSVIDEENWLFAVVRNAIRKTKSPRSAYALADALEIADHLEQVAWLSPEGHLEVMEVMRALQAMDDKYKVPMLLAAQGIPMHEVANSLKISLHAATKRVSRGRALLRKRTGYARPERTLSRIEEGRPE